MDAENNTQWNNNILKLLNKIGRKTMGYRWMHDQASQFNQNSHNTYKIVEIILAAVLDLITGGELCGFIFNNGLNQDKTLIITIACIQFVLLIVSHVIVGIKTASDFEKNVSRHDHAATKFGEINLSIQQKLALEIKYRGDDKEFLNHIIKTFTDLLVIAPKIDQKIQNEYVEKSEDNDIFSTPLINEDDLTDVKIQSEEEAEHNYQIDRWLRNF
jgi:hypothetical protein